MASKHISTKDRNGVILITVKHLDTDSFSRSVDRVAYNVWKKLPYNVGVRTRYVRRDFAHTCVGRECWSTIGYGPSPEAVEAALAAERGA